MKKTPIVTTIIFVGVWLAYALWMNDSVEWNTSIRRGEWGDTFGALTALVGCLTAAGLVYTLLQQGEMIRQQGEMLTAQKSQLELDRRSIDAMKATERCRASQEIILCFYSDEMRQVRLDAWKIMCATSDGRCDDVKIKDFLVYMTSLSDHSFHVREEYQKVSRMLDYFALADLAIEKRTASGTMINGSIGHYYYWWRERLIKPMLAALRSMPPVDPKGGAQGARPRWMRPLESLDKALTSEGAE
jgi:hypothetical protein